MKPTVRRVSGYLVFFFSGTEAALLLAGNQQIDVVYGATLTSASLVLASFLTFVTTSVLLNREEQAR